MKTIPKEQAETRPGTGSSTGGGGGGGQPKVWTITGRMHVRESEIDGVSHDRPLKGIEIKLSASDISGDGPWTEWGIVRTDADGDFTVSETNDGRTRFLRVMARLNSADLEVDDGTMEDIKSLDLLDNNWRTVWKSAGQLEGPAVSLGTKVVASGGAYDLGDATFRRSAMLWYVARAAMDRLKAEDPWFSPPYGLHVIYPAHTITQSSFQGSGGKIYLQEGETASWHPETLMYFMMLQWHDEHTEGSRKISGWPSAHFAFGFALFAANALKHELWGTRLDVPLNRRAVAETLAISTLDEIQDSETGVQNALRILLGEERQGWWSLLFGTALAYPDGQPDDNGDGWPDHPGEVGVKHRLDKREVPTGPNHLSLWDILHTFRANPAKGWKTDLDVGDPNHSVLEFIDRAVDIHDLGDEVRKMLRDCIDPLGITEPFEHLPKI